VRHVYSENNQTGSGLRAEVREARLLLSLAGATMRHAQQAARVLGSEEELFGATVTTLREAEFGNGLVKRVLSIRENGAHRKLEDDLAKRGGKVVVHGEVDYPCRLRAIPDAPAALYVRGSLPPDSQPVVAIIGSRRCTPEGLRFALEIGEDLAQGGVAIVSGLARGIDSAALRGCLRRNTPAVGVLGSGLDFVYPPENRDLFDQIGKEGALLTEFPLGIRPTKHLFPRRNRLISGLSEGVLVVEASDRSGTLITVDHAIDQNRVVMAVPGAVGGPFSRGTNRLIRDGAQVILSPNDVFVSIGIPSPTLARKERKTAELSGFDARVFELCADRASTADTIAWRTQASINQILGSLARLETQGLVKRFSGGRFLAIRDS